MSKIAGYFLVLSEERYKTFSYRDREDFAEPVSEFSHSKNVPLICFIVDPSNQITHIGLGKRGFASGTELRKLKIWNIEALKEHQDVTGLLDATSKRVKRHLTYKSQYGGKIPPKSFDEFLSIVLDKVPETKSMLSKYSIERRQRIEKLKVSERSSLAVQKEAVLTALNLAGIDRSEASDWDYSEGDDSISFLSGIKGARLMEDSMIINDLENVPGFDIIERYKFSANVFENERTRLTVLLANKLPLEELTGTDLIYYNEDFECFTLVQYKMMEKEGIRFKYRLPNEQLSKEIERMDSILEHLSSHGSQEDAQDYRINSDPFFLKFCPRLDFDPDNVGLSKGMYLSLGYFKSLQNDKAIEGERGGRAISYENVGRHLNNTTFKTIIENGWIGTYKDQSEVLKEILKEIIEGGKAAVLAVKKKMNPSERNIYDDLFEEDD